MRLGKMPYNGGKIAQHRTAACQTTACRAET
jgi:hypothetical protein